MKEKHIRLELIPAASTAGSSRHSVPINAVGWNLATRAHQLKLERGSAIDLAYRIRENDHPQYGGLQIEIAGIQLAENR
jgi:single-stranded-DNA-specific exonuclease